MLRKIDCVMVRVPDLTPAVEFYARVFGNTVCLLDMSMGPR